MKYEVMFPNPDSPGSFRDGFVFDTKAEAIEFLSQWFPTAEDCEALVYELDLGPDGDEGGVEGSEGSG